MVKKRVKIVIIVVICFLSIIAGSCFILYREFKQVNNPIMAGIGLIEIMVFNKDLVLIQENPKIILANPNNASKSANDSLFEYMSHQNFSMTDRLGSLIIFENNLHEKQNVSFHVNRYYSIWKWN